MPLLKSSDMQVSVPGGGEPITGMGETIQVSPFTGSVVFSVENLVYSNQGGNSVLGQGFLSPTSEGIQRRTFGTPTYNDAKDTFLLDGKILVPQLDKATAKPIVKRGRLEDRTINNQTWREAVVSDNSGAYWVRYYQQMEENDFSIIQYWNWEGGNVAEGYPSSFWQVLASDNSVRVFGTDSFSRISNPQAPEKVYKWLPVEVLDAKGYSSMRTYLKENTDNVDVNSKSEKGHVQTANRYLHSECSGHQEPIPQPISFLSPEEKRTPAWFFEKIYDYGEYDTRPENTNPYQIPPGSTWDARKDPFSRYQPGFEVRCHRLIKNILQFNRFEELGEYPVLERVIALRYDEKPEMTHLIQIEEIGYYWRNNIYEVKAIPPIELNYTKFDPQENNTQYREILDAGTKQPLPNIGGGAFIPIDLYSVGCEGLLYSNGMQAYYLTVEETDESDPGSPVCFSKEVCNIPLPQGGLSQDIANSFMDLFGDGKLSYVHEQPGCTGYYRAIAENSWGGFHYMTGYPSEGFGPDTRAVDMTGDGVPDRVLILDGGLRYYKNTGQGGFENGVDVVQPQLPNTMQSSATQITTFSGVGGDGKPALTLLNRDGLTYWPMYGYGEFGQAIEMDGFPEISDNEFVNGRVFLQNVCGTSASDLVLVKSDSVWVYPNQSGNSFGDPFQFQLPEGVRYDDLDTLLFADVLGVGMPQIIYSQTVENKQYLLSVNNGIRPHLLSGYSNNLGAETELTYKSSYQYYAKDKANGNLWNTTLPFAVQVVSQILNRDAVSDSELSESYHYQDPWFDPVEREFTGFAYVSYLDAQLFEGVASHLESPPAKNKIWFHTGNPNQAALTAIYEKTSYFQGDVLAQTLSEYAVEIDNRTITKESEALKRQSGMLLRGFVLHSEVFGMDKSSNAPYPYSVSNENATIRLLQEPSENGYFSLQLLQRENLSYNYERNPLDPMMGYSASLYYNPYGVVIQSCSISYGRRKNQAQNFDQEAMEKIRCSSSIERVLNLTNAEIQIDVGLSSDQLYILGIPYESEQYTIENIESIGELENGGIYSYKQLKAFLCVNNPEAGLPFSQDVVYFKVLWQQNNYLYPISGASKAVVSRTPQIEMIGLERTNDRALLLEGIEYNAAYDQDELLQQLNAYFTEEELKLQMQDIGKYDSNQGYWWIPGETLSFSNAAVFYLPAAITDPMGNVTTVTYDTHLLLLVKTVDALNNTNMITKIDYQLVSGVQTTDQNGNVSEVVVDPLKKVIATSFYGGEVINGEYNSDVGFYSLFGEDKHKAPYVMQPDTNKDAILSDPFSYLQNAASFYSYNAYSWMGTTFKEDYISLGVQETLIDSWLLVLKKDGLINEFGALSNTLRNTVKNSKDSIEFQMGLEDKVQFLSFFKTLEIKIKNKLFSALKEIKTEQPVYVVSLTADDFPNTSHAQISKQDYQFYIPDIAASLLDTWWNQQVENALISEIGVFSGGYRELIQASSSVADFIENIGAISTSLLASFSAFTSEQQNTIYQMLEQAIRFRISQTVIYNDGFGRVLSQKTRAQNGTDCLLYNAETGVVTNNNSETWILNRWISSGNTLYDNKGQVVRQYQNFYVNSSDYFNNEMLYELSNSPTMYYDALGRNNLVITAKGYLQLTVYNAWSEKEWDTIDTFLLSPYYLVNKENILEGNTTPPSKTNPYYVYFDDAMTDEERAMYKRTISNTFTPSQNYFDNLKKTRFSSVVNVGEIHREQMAIALGYTMEEATELIEELITKKYAMRRESYKMVFTPPENPTSSEQVPVFWAELIEGFPFAELFSEILLDLYFNFELAKILGLLYNAMLTGEPIKKYELFSSFTSLYGVSPFNLLECEALWEDLVERGYLSAEGIVSPSVKIPKLNLSSTYANDNNKIVVYLTVLWAKGFVQTSYFTYDSIGRPLTIADPRLHENGALTMEYLYPGALGESVHQISCDSGDFWELVDVLGKSMWTREARGVEITTAYDALSRPIVSYASLVEEGNTQAVWGPVVFQRIQYGEEAFGGDIEKTQQYNYRGQQVQFFGQGGWNSMVLGYTITGGGLGTKIQMSKAYKPAEGYSVAPPLVIVPELGDNPCTPNDPEDVLQDAFYTESAWYDANGKILQSLDAANNETIHIDNPTGNFKRRFINNIPYIDNRQYNALGMPTETEYYNEELALVVKTFFRYSKFDYQLKQIYTTHNPDGLGDTSNEFEVISTVDSDTRQSLIYATDPKGNVGNLDGMYQAVFPELPETNGEMQVFNPSSDNRYDALDRLIEVVKEEN